jgi:UDP-glucuronate decarboxylase
VKFTTLVYLRIIIHLLGSTSSIEMLPPTQDDPKRRRPSIQRAKDVLGWEPKVTLQEGIRKTVEYFRTELQQSLF